MKKTILLLLFAVVSLSSLKAQESSESGAAGGIYVGGKVGYGIVNYESTINAEKNFATMTYNNMSFGILAGYKLNSLISFQLEGNFAQYGARNIIPTYIYSPLSPLLADRANSTVHRVDMNLYNVDVPVTVKLTLKEGNFSPYVYGGINYGIIVSGKTSIVREVTFNDAINYETSKDDITARIISNEFAPVVGGGVVINMFNLSFFGDVRYKYGITNLSNIDNKLGFTNSALWVSAGVLFNL